MPRRGRVTALALIAVLVLVALIATHKTGASGAGSQASTSSTSMAQALATATQPADATSNQPTALAPPAEQPAGGPAYDSAFEWPLVDMQANRLWASTRGTGITVAIVDTGIDSQLPDLDSAVVGRKDLTPGPPGDQSSDSDGTAIAGLIAGRGSSANPEIVAGLAPQAGLIDVRVTRDEHHVSTDLLAQGIDAAIYLGAKIIDVPLGVPTDESALDDAVENAEQHNCLVIASISASGAPQWPADTNGVIAVAATTGHTMAPGDSLDKYGPYAVYAPGTGLYSTVKNGYRGNLSGNDYASAYVAAAAALVWAAQPGLSAVSIRQRLVSDVSGSSASSVYLGTLDPAMALRVQSPTPGVRTTKPASPVAAPAPGTASLPVLVAAGVGLAAIVLFVVLWFLTRGGPRLPPPLDWDLEPR
jgi:Subtilase family